MGCMCFMVYIQVFVVGCSDLMKWFGFCDQYSLLVLTLAAWMPVQLYNYIYMYMYEFKAKVLTVSEIYS